MWLLVLPVAAGTGVVVVDDQDGAPGFTTTTENWATWEAAGYGYDDGDTSYHYLSQTVGDGTRRGTATWTPEIPRAGVWRVEVWFRRTENRTSDADHVVTDGAGDTDRVSIDQRGDGASGWVTVGEYWCAAGTGGCTLTLDGTDDSYSDEANAARFVLVDPTDDGEDTGAIGLCDDATGPGPHARTLSATDADAEGWEDPGRATGAADGAEAHSENVDEGEFLEGSGWDACDPDGTETIDRVEVSVLARTQYESGTYALDLRLDAGGDATAEFTGTDAAWHTVDVTADRSGWTWADIVSLDARVSLAGHPGGARDSDAWVDAFALLVEWTGVEPTDSGGPGDSADTGPGGDRGPHGNEPRARDTAERSCGCGAPGGVGGLFGLPLLVSRRRRPAPASPR